MPRGCRNGFLTKVNLAARLAGAAVPGASEIKPEKASARALLGHAIFHKVVSDFEVAETVERKESTVPCYLFTHVQHSGQRDAIEKYVVAASQLFRRGTIIANLMAMGRVGSSSDEDRLSSQRPRFTSDVAVDIGDAMTDVVVGDSDVRNSVVKQVFLPERWPTATVPRDPEITAVLDAYGDLVPRLPDWTAVMGPAGWDNAINRMATKFAGNVKVHMKKNLLQSVCKYLDTASLHDAASRSSVIDVVQRRLRPLAIHDEDYEMAVLLRRALGVRDDDVTWYPPKEVGAVTRDVLTLHLFLVRQGVCGRSYLPVATRGRKYCYLDTKILTPLFAGTTEAVTALLSKSAKAAYDKAKKAKEKKKVAAEAASGAGPSRPTENEVGTEDVVDETASVSVGEMLEITGHSFNAKRKKLRQTLRRRYRKTSRAETPGRKKRRLCRLAQCWARSGSGRLRSGTRIDSAETDGVGLRLCVKTPVDMRPFIVQVPLPSQEASTSSVVSGGLRKKKAPKSKGVPDDFVPEGDDGAAPPIVVGIDTGRAKLFVAAVSKSAIRKPETVAFTRRRYYYEMAHHRHRRWERGRTDENPQLIDALAGLASSGGLRNCDVQRWRAYLGVDRDNDELLHTEYVVYKERALWKMRMFRWKRRSLDRAALQLTTAATRGEAVERPLVFAVGDAGFASTGRGELPAPTAELTKAFKRALSRVSRSGRRVHVFGVNEFRTTMCCCACGKVTRPPEVDYKARDGTRQRKASGRLRGCTDCVETPVKLRDRDVQAARNMVWLAYGMYTGQERLGYMRRGGPSVEEDAATIANAASSRATRSI